MNKNISHHHGNCDMCGKRHILILMFGYLTQREACYSICQNCLAKNIKQIIYGFHNYKDGLID
jgi:hypothetical protein